jgi:hypothetical protein
MDLGVWVWPGNGDQNILVHDKTPFLDIGMQYCNDDRSYKQKGCPLDGQPIFG